MGFQGLPHSRRPRKYYYKRCLFLPGASAVVGSAEKRVVPERRVLWENGGRGLGAAASSAVVAGLCGKGYRRRDSLWSVGVRYGSARRRTKNAAVARGCCRGVRRRSGKQHSAVNCGSGSQRRRPSSSGGKHADSGSSLNAARGVVFINTALKQSPWPWRS